VLQDTYSWGNGANPKGWHKNAAEDRAAAQEFLQIAKREKWNLKNMRVADESLDPFVDAAFYQLNKKDNGHINWGIAKNCKAEATKLLELARELHAKAKPLIAHGATFA
jgi:hypothetical protein